jgi:hypothetical protein
MNEPTNEQGQPSNQPTNQPTNQPSRWLASHHCNPTQSTPPPPPHPQQKKQTNNNSDIARACGFLDHPNYEGAMFLPFSNPASNVTDPPVFPTIIAREQLSRSSALGRTAAREPDSIGYAVKNCERLKRCRDPNFLRQQMGPKTPELRVFQCDVATGRATPFVYQPTPADMELRRRPQNDLGNV